MVVKLQKDPVSEIKYNFNKKGGKSIIERVPVFSPDGELLAVIVENTVRGYNIQTGECVRILETESHTEELIAIEFPRNEEYNLIGCSVEGNITVWTWVNGVVLREKKLQIPTDMKILTFNLLNSHICLLSLGSPSQKFIRLVSYSLQTGFVEIDYKGTQPQYYDMIRVSLGWFDGDRFAALTNGTKMLFVQNLTKPHVRDQIINQTYIRIMSVAVHNGMIAITDALGRLSILRGSLFDNRLERGREVLHWHFLPLLCSAFSVQGNHIYTGGLEKVLVKWAIGSAYKPQDKEFMPRLPATIRYIATNNAYVAVTLSNNSIVIANTQLRTTATILECGGLSPVMRAIGGTLIYHNRLGGLLIPGRAGHLQFYSTTTDRVLYNIDITQTNELPPERHCLLPLDTEITCAAISANGTFLATSEYRNDGINYPEEKLKFWYATLKGSAPFQLNTCVNLSHGGCNVVALAFDNQGNYCVSAGADQKFRIWKLKNQSRTGKTRRYFECLTACYYSSGVGQYLSHDILNNLKHHNVNTYGKEKYDYLRNISEDDVILKLINVHKEHALVDSNVLSTGMRRNDDSDMGSIAISQDGSLIAAWFGCKLTLWDSQLCNIRTSLSHPALRPKGLQVKFGSKDAAHYLVCTTENCLAVWSLLSLTIRWMVQIKPSCLAADRHSNRMAVVTQENDLFVFTPHSSTPVLSRKRLLNPDTGVFKQITFGSDSNDEIRLFLMRNNSEIYTIEPEKPDKSHLKVMTWQDNPVSKFGAMIAQQQLSEVAEATPGVVSAKNVDKAARGAMAQITSGAPHMVPPVSLFVTSFLHQVSGSVEPEENDETTEDNMEVDDIIKDSDDEVETPLKGPSPRVMELWTSNYDAIKEKKLNKIMKEPFLESNAASSLFSV